MEYNITFVHPTTGATLTAEINPEMTVYEVIAALIDEQFIPYGLYDLDINGERIGGSETLLSVGLKDNECVNADIVGYEINSYVESGIFRNEISENELEKYLVIIEISSYQYLSGRINPKLTAEELITILKEKKYLILPVDRYYIEIEGNKVESNQTLASGGLVNGGFIRMKCEALEYTITFIHPTTGATLTANVNPALTADEVISCLVDEQFITAPDDLTYYDFCIRGGYNIAGRVTLLSGGIKQDGEVHVRINQNFSREV